MNVQQVAAVVLLCGVNWNRCDFFKIYFHLFYDYLWFFILWFLTNLLLTCYNIYAQTSNIFFVWTNFTFDHSKYDKLFTFQQFQADYFEDFRIEGKDSSNMIYLEVINENLLRALKSGQSAQSIKIKLIKKQTPCLMFEVSLVRMKTFIGSDKMVKYCQKLHSLRLK